MGMNVRELRLHRFTHLVDIGRKVLPRLRQLKRHLVAEKLKLALKLTLHLFLRSVHLALQLFLDAGQITLDLTLHRFGDRFPLFLGIVLHRSALLADFSYIAAQATVSQLLILF